ncbi:tagaturonate reductase [Sphingobacterium bovistauri]|uniref:Tagaturonate reductase n=1 Tax=Sphingobacterium bovistauri TaxID=2781959 RepID=A0ABS7Z1G2_9SPHI|nr:tagaturonate reductase [Sphingobacterium bovistauri]MCA5004011.1 tagaturonate reductase [Sphingobacterium bovistauri]
MKILSTEILQDISAEKVQIPTTESFAYPEKVIQFGTGVLLRGLPDYYIDKANKKQLFKGRVVVVKSTTTGSVEDFLSQEGLYTVCVKGIEDGKEREEYIINNSITRVLEAASQWAEILKIAESSDLEVIISNTTEVGIVSSDDKVTDLPPSSFPGKLLNLLYHRYQTFNGDTSKGLVILPTELISDNATVLKDIVLTLAEKNNLEGSFIHWLSEANDFCNTLVDRIVPGKLPEEVQMETNKQLGYSDNLMIMAEPFRLWAIESSSDRVRDKLSFAQADDSVLIVPSIVKYKEIKLRLLNATHTFTCAAAILAGFKTVKEAMQNEIFRSYVQQLMRQEIGPSIVGLEITEEEARQFSDKVVDRFSNPFLDHQWTAIAMNYSSKVAMRCVPLLGKWYAKFQSPPKLMAFGIAAFLKMHVQQEGVSTDDIIKDQKIWGADLTAYPQFVNTINDNLEKIASQGIVKTLSAIK